MGNLNLAWIACAHIHVQRRNGAYAQVTYLRQKPQLVLLPVVNWADINMLEAGITLSDILESYGVAKRGAD